MIVFTPTWDETVDGFDELLRGDLDVRADAIAARRARLKQFVLWAMLAGFAVVAIPVLIRRRIFPDPQIAAAVPAFGLMAYHLLIRPRLEAEVQLKARERAAAWARLKFWALCRPTEVGLCDDGIWLSNDRFSSVIRWGSVTKCAVGARAVFISTGRLEGHALPIRAFADRAAAQSFVSEILAAQRRAGVHPEDRIAAMIASNAMRCPSCRYDLSAIRTTICPECGTNFDAEAEQRRESIE